MILNGAPTGDPKWCTDDPKWSTDDPEWCTDYPKNEGPTPSEKTKQNRENKTEKTNLVTTKEVI